MDTGEEKLSHMGPTASSTQNSTGGLLNIPSDRSPRSGMRLCLAGACFNKNSGNSHPQEVRKHWVGKAELSAIWSLQRNCAHSHLIRLCARHWVGKTSPSRGPLSRDTTIYSLIITFISTRTVVLFLCELKLSEITCFQPEEL